MARCAGRGLRHDGWRVATHGAATGTIRFLDEEPGPSGQARRGSEA